jgi:hypothetical protein
MKAKSPSSNLDRCSGVQFFRKLRQLPEAPLRLNRAIEILLHAYNYVRRVDLDKESRAADLIWSKYEELKRKQRRQNPARSLLTLKENL